MPARPITLTALVGLLLTAAACDQPPQAPPPKPPKPFAERLGELPATDVIRALPTLSATSCSSSCWTTTVRLVPTSKPSMGT